MMALLLFMCYLTLTHALDFSAWDKVLKGCTYKESSQGAIAHRLFNYSALGEPEYKTLFNDFATQVVLVLY